MVYLWKSPENFLNRDMGEYDRNCSPDRFLLREGTALTVEKFTRCVCYLRSASLNLPDDPFVRCQLRHEMQVAYVFTPEEMFYIGGTETKINISAENLKKLKTALALTDADIDKPFKVLSSKQLQDIAEMSGYPQFSPRPVVNFKVAKKRLLKFDCLPNSTLIPLVNNRIKTILEDLAPDDVQFFPAKLLCSDGELEGYYFLNITQTIIGIDHEKSVCTKMKNMDFISGFHYLTYKPGCMGEHHLARDREALGNLLVSEKIKSIFDKEHITGVGLVRPEDYYRPFTASDLINEWKRDQSDQ